MFSRKFLSKIVKNKRLMSDLNLRSIRPNYNEKQNGLTDEGNFTPNEFNFFKGVLSTGRILRPKSRINLMKYTKNVLRTSPTST